jgi:DNA-binding LacI/PurR family transcriptional regulator
MMVLHARERGFHVEFNGKVGGGEFKTLERQLLDELAGMDEPFVLVLDVRTFRHFSADAQADLEILLRHLLDHGLSRIAVLAASTAYAGLFCEMMVRIEAMDLYAYIDAAYEQDWEQELEEALEFEAG